MPVPASRLAFAGRVWDVRVDDVAFPDGVVRRDVLVHPGAVAIVALDDRDRVLLIQQYRHPVSGLLWEIPAGLLDVADEPPLGTAQRELAEEAGLRAREWSVLADVLNSPGGSTEGLRIFLARGLTEIPEGRAITGEAEEAHLPQSWVDVDEAVAMVLRGDLHNVSTVAGILATQASRTAQWLSLRPADAPWEWRPHPRTP